MACQYAIKPVVNLAERIGAIFFGDRMQAKPWPAQAIEMRRRAELRAFEKNSRTHSKAQIRQIADSILEWGWTIPVLVDPSGEVIAGHGRLQAAELLGIDELPCMVAAGWSEAQRRAYVIADNKLAENAAWDDDILAEEMAWLRDQDFAMEATGFSEKEVMAMLGAQAVGLTDADDVPAVEAIAVSAIGDKWLLGGHTIVCGSCTDPGTVALALGDVKPHLMVTDPPYGVKYDAGWRERAGVGGRGTAKGKVLNDDIADWREAWALFPGDVAYVWHAGLFAGVVGDSLQATGFTLRSQIIWAKSQLVMSRGDYHWQHEPCWYAVRSDAEGECESQYHCQHEPCWYAVRNGKPGQYDGGRKQTTLWTIDKPKKSETGHSTQKPVECMQRPIENNSSPGQSVYEPFSGSGTTIIACEMTGRKCHAIELNPLYVDVAVRRWQDYTGERAVLAGDGRSFDEVSAARAAA